MCGCRYPFFDISEVILDDGEQLVGARKNLSPIFYFGRRYSIDELQGYMWAINYYRKQSEITSVIKCDCGYIIENPDDNCITMLEYQEQLARKLIKPDKK